MYVGGIVLICTGVGAPLGVALAIGGVIGLATQFFQEEIGKAINSLIGEEGAQAVGGGFSYVMGGVTINVGSKLIGKGGAWGTVGGSICILIGVLLSAFGASELIEVTFNCNPLKELPFMSDSLYNNLYRALNYAASAIVVVYSTLTQYYTLVSKNKHPKLVEFNKAKELKKLVNQAGDKQSIIDDIVKNNSYSAVDSDTWKMVARLDDFNPIGNGITKEQLIANKGKGYIVNRKNPKIYLEIKDGIIQFNKKMANKYSYIDFPENTHFPKNRKMQNFDKAYADKLNLSKNKNIIPKQLKDIVGDREIRWQDIRDFRSKGKYVWHEDITGRVMLIEKAVHNTGRGFNGIPHIGVVAGTNKNVNASRVYELIKQLRSK